MFSSLSDDGRELDILTSSERIEQAQMVREGETIDDERDRLRRRRRCRSSWRRQDERRRQGRLFVQISCESMHSH